MPQIEKVKMTKAEFEELYEINEEIVEDTHPDDEPTSPQDDTVLTSEEEIFDETLAEDFSNVDEEKE